MRLATRRFALDVLPAGRAVAEVARRMAVAVLATSALGFPAVAVERVRPNPPNVITVDPSSLTVVRAVETSVKVPPLVPVPGTGIHEVVPGAPVRTRIRDTREVVTPGENGAPAPVPVRPAEPAKVTPAREPRLAPAAPLARRDNTLGDLGYLDVEQGMLSAYPNAMLQDRRGFLWITSWGGGLSRYDGTSFAHLTLEQGLPSDKPETLLEDRAGNLWLGTSAGLIRYDGVAFTHFTTKQGLPDDNVGQMAEDRHGNLWLCTDKGVCRYDGTTFTTFRKAQGLTDGPVSAVHEARDGAIWLATESGAFRFDGRSFTRFGSEDGLVSGALTAIAEDPDGGLWFAGKGGVSRLDTTTVVTYGAAQGLGEEVGQMLVDRGGAVWLSTRRGVFQLVRNPGGEDPVATVLHLSEEHGLSHYRTAFVFEDRAGFIWIGTLGGGVCRLRPGSFRHFTSKEGLSDGRVWAVAQAPDGALWLATDKGVNRFDGESFAHLPVVGGAGRDQVHAVYVDRRGSLWIGTAANGIYRYDGSSLVHVVPEDGKDVGRIWSFAEAPDGQLWIGSGTGAFRYDGTSFFRYPKALLGGSAAYLFAGPDGTVWALRRKGGVSHLVGSTLTELDPKGALGSAESNVGLFDRQGRLWIGTRTGIAVYDGTWLLLIREADGLSSPLVFSLAMDAQGAVWAATEHGLNRIVLAPSGGTPRIQTFGREEGLKAVDFNQGTGLFDRRGQGWWGTGKALSMLPPGSAFDAPREPPRVRLLGLDLNESSVDYRDLLRRRRLGESGASQTFPGVDFTGVAPFTNVPEGLELPFDVKGLTFHFSAVEWGAPHQVQYQSMLSGDREEWGPPRRDTQVVYRNLEPGRYVLKVRARFGSEAWGAPAELSFTMRPPWWLTWWAKTLWALVGLLAVFGVVKLRVRALEARRAELETQVAERTAELARQKDRLEVSEREAQAAKEQALSASRAKSLFLANMSHELRTPLNAVLGFSQLLDREGGLLSRHHEELGIIQRSGEHLLGLINDVLSLSKIEAGSFTRVDQPFDLHDMLSSVQAIVRVRAEAKDLDLVFEVDESLPRTVKADEGKLRQVLVNLLGNAVKFTERGRVTLRARWTGGRATFEIEDTGPGIAEGERDRLFRAFSQTETGLSAKEGTGLGLVISRQIVQLMGGDIGVTSRVGTGTTFFFDVDLPVSDAVPARRPRRVVSLAAGQESLRILVVDDTLENRLLLTRLLGGVGFDVREAFDGAEAISACESFRPHLVFMDMRMPVIDGREATRRIRARDRELSRHTVVVALTASALDHERAELSASGADGVLAKPFAVDELFETIAQHTGVRYRYADDGEARSGTRSVVPPRTLPGIDVAAGLRRASGNEALYRQLLGQALAQLGDVVPRLASLLAAPSALTGSLRDAADAAPSALTGSLRDAKREGSEALSILHTLKGSAGTLGMSRVAQVAATVEAALVADPNARPDLSALSAAIDEARRAADPWLSRDGAAEGGSGGGAPSRPMAPGRARDALAITGRLRQRLAEGSLEASAEVEDLRGVLDGRLPEVLTRLDDCVAQLDFPAALTVLSELEGELTSASIV